MTPSQQKLAKFQAIRQLVDESLTREEFLKSFQSAVGLIIRAETKLNQKVDAKLMGVDVSVQKSLSGAQGVTTDAKNALALFKEEARMALAEAKAANDSTFANVKQRALESIDSLFNRMRLNEKLNKALKDFSTKADELNAQILQVPDKETLVQAVFALIPPDVEETAVETRDKLETLTGEERLDVSAIRGVDAIVEELKSTNKNVRVGWGAHPITVYDSTGAVIDKNVRFIKFGTNLTTTRSGSGVITVTGSAGGGSSTIYSELLTDSGDHQNFTALHTIDSVISFMDASGKGVPNNLYTFTGTTVTLSAPDANLASLGLYLIYGNTGGTAVTTRSIVTTGNGQFGANAGDGSVRFSTQGQDSGNLIPFPGTVKNLFIILSQNTDDGPTVFTIIKNGVSTGITATAAAGDTTTISDLTHTVNVVAGDLIQVQVNSLLSSTGAAVWGFSYEVSS